MSKKSHGNTQLGRELAYTVNPTESYYVTRDTQSRLSNRDLDPVVTRGVYATVKPPTKKKMNKLPRVARLAREL